MIASKDISNDLSLLLEEGLNEVFILNQISSFIQQLFMISSHARIYAVVNPIEVLGYNPPKNIWEKKSKLAINIKPKQFLEMLRLYFKFENKYKNREN